MVEHLFCPIVQTFDLDGSAMRLDTARELKDELSGVAAAAAASSLVHRSGGPTRAQFSGPARLSLGISVRPGGGYGVAIRAQAASDLRSALGERLLAGARSEADVRVTGVVRALGDPLSPGTSVGHSKVTAGTLGCFVKDLETGQAAILSNNHVLANCNDARVGDLILAPGPLDGGTVPEDKVGTLLRFVRLEVGTPNAVDVAVALVNEDRVGDNLFDGVQLTGVFPDEDLENLAVGKTGRTTGQTAGAVTAIELDGVDVLYPSATYGFDGVIEVTGATSSPFSLPGDSGSLIHTAGSERLAVGLLFAGTGAATSSTVSVTYANPISAALDMVSAQLLG